MRVYYADILVCRRIFAKQVQVFRRMMMGGVVVCTLAPLRFRIVDTDKFDLSIHNSIGFKKIKIKKYLEDCL